MSTVAEIEAALRELSTAELQRIEAALRKHFEERNSRQKTPRIASPRLAHPEQAPAFVKTLVTNAKV